MAKTKKYTGRTSKILARIRECGAKTGRKCRSFWSKLKVWQRAAVVIPVALILIGLGVWIYMTNRQPGTETVVAISSNTPSATRFQDDKPMAFVVNDDNDDDYSGKTRAISLPEPNNDRELYDIQNLYISFNVQSGVYAPAFKMDLEDADLENNIKIDPFVKGKWSTYGPDAVQFAASRDWPANQKFTVTVNKKILNSDIKFQNTKASFTTAAFTADVKSFDVYPDLSKQKSMVAVGVVSFNYPVDIKTFNDGVTLKLDGKKIGFTVKFDTFNRTAFITSDIITVRDAPQKLKLDIARVDTLQGNATSAAKDASVTIESQDNFFKIDDVSTHVVDNDRGEPEQLILMNLTSSARDVDWDKYIGVYLLPRHNKANGGDGASHAWKNDEITEDILAKSVRIDARPIDFANPSGVYQYAFAYDVSEKQTRYIYVDIKPGFMSDMGFPLKNGTQKIMRVPYPEKQVKIAGTGAILSMAGSRELAVMARGGADAAYINLSKVKSSEINHLISQTYGLFSSLEFRGYNFNEQDISVVFNKKIGFADTSFKKTNYASVNLDDYLNKTIDKTGIFIVQVGSSYSNADYNDRRLILLTDLGIIRKINSDETSALFVSSIASGNPISGADVRVLGRNGGAVWSGETDGAGRVIIPKLSSSEYQREKEPVAFVVTRGGDVSFMPYNINSNYEMEVSYSKYDIEGVHQSAENPMNAYLFSDRGIYRPGEEFIIGGIVKDKNFKSLSGVPVKLEIRDSRSKLIVEKTFSLAADGLFDSIHTLSGAAPIGDYSVRLYSLTDKNKNNTLLARDTMRIEEFTPDVLKIKASVDNAKPAGWIKSSDLRATVSLRNLFGTPATDRRIASRAVLSPTGYSFAEFKDYKFTPNFISGTGLSKKSVVAPETLYQNMTDIKTDRDGVAAIDIKFDANVNPGTYTLSFTAEGFEGDSGKSVSAAASTRVSDATYLVGYKPSSDLGYINKGSKRSLNVIAIDSDVKKIAVDKLSYRIVRKQNLVSLVKDYNGYYKYQSVTREKVIKTADLSIPAKGIDIALDTSVSGDHYIQMTDASGKVLAHTDYFVAGTENLTLAADQQAELKVRLNQSEYAAGDQIQVNITSPYVGAGLITIEKDKVYAHRWFKTSTTSSVQTITLPDGFEGSGYINVSFVRDIHSKDVFTTPYAYAVAPFTVDRAKRTINIDLKAPDVVRDKKLTVTYTADKSSRLMIFAVNEGILQVAKYRSPEPLGHFFKKSALQVTTYQILSLLLPEYKILREFARTGGGDYEEAAEMLRQQNITNPFARTLDKPVAFYSGIIDAQADVPGSVTFDIPDHFNGGIRVYAVAAGQNAMGSAQTETKIQSPVIISETVPPMAVPNDEFTVNAVISNMTGGSGDAARVRASVKTSDNLTVVGDGAATIAIAEGTEQLWKFNVRTNNALGNADVVITAEVLDTAGKILASNTSTSTLSVRPASLFGTHVVSGFSMDKKTTVKDFQIDMYREMAAKTLYVSDRSFILIKPLFEFLRTYEYSCSEQTVSKTLPFVLFPADDFLDTTQKASADKVQSAINVLKNRQNDNGSFNLWETYGNRNYDFERNEVDVSDAYVTAYVVQFLTLARDAGFAVPNAMLSRGIDYLRTYSGKNIQNNYDASVKAFAIYLVTRNGYVTTAYIDGFEDYAAKNIPDWKKSLSGAYIAASYKILKQDDKARALVREYAPDGSKKFRYDHDYSNNVVNDANWAYLANTYFKNDIPQDKIMRALDGVRAYIAGGYYSSFTSAAAILALAGFGNDGNDITDAISVVATSGKDTVNLHAAAAGTRGVYKAAFADNVSRLDISCESCDKNRGIFYTIIQQGFARKVAATENGIEVTRDYYNKDGDKITRAAVGDEITVKISLRATDGSNYIDNVVIADLLPAGFAIVMDSISGSYDFHEPREDRMLIYRSVGRRVSTITYRVKATAAGTFTVPAVQAASMYNPALMSVGRTSEFKVENVTVD